MKLFKNPKEANDWLVESMMQLSTNSSWKRLHINIKISFIKEILEGIRFDLSDEKKTQDIIYDKLSQIFPKLKREYKLGKYGTIDFFLDGIGIEVKIKNSASASSILRQCKRYCESDQIKVFLLITGRSIGFPREINGKPCYYISLSRGML